MKFKDAIEELQNNSESLKFALLLVQDDTIEMLINLDTMTLYPLYRELGLAVNIDFIKDLIEFADDWRILNSEYSNVINLMGEKIIKYTPKIYYGGVYDGLSRMKNDCPTLYYSCDFGRHNNGIRLWITLPDKDSTDSHIGEFMNFNQTMCMNIVTPRILTIHDVPADSKMRYINTIRRVIDDAKSSVIIVHDKNELKGIIYFHSMIELMNMSDEYIEEFDSSKTSTGDLLKFGYARIEFNVDDNGDVVDYTSILSFTPPSYESIIK